MALSEIDRNLLDRCLAKKPRSWEDFVDRFMGLVVHVVNHTAGARSIRLAHEDLEDLCAEVFLVIIKDDFAVLRRFRGHSSLATYLTVVARRVVVRELLKRKPASPLAADVQSSGSDGPSHSPQQRLDDREEVQRLIDGLQGSEAQIVRLYHLEGKSYQEISSVVDMPVNSIGPTLTRARQRMRRAADSPQS